MMSKLSLLDKLKVLGDVTSSSNLYIVVIVILLALAILLITTSTKTKKISKRVCMIIYTTITLVSIIFYREELSKFFDYMMDNFFIAVYFPNVAIYFAAVVATNIILWVSIFNRKINKWIRTINTFMYCFIHYLLIVIINVIIKNKLDIFDQASIYQNETAQALIELSSTIFIVWILFLATYKIIRIYQGNQELEEKEIQPQPLTTQPEPRVITETKVERRLPDAIRKVEVPIMVIGQGKKTTLQEESSTIIDLMKQPLPSYDNSYLMDIPSPTKEEEPQFLDVMLRDQEIMKPLKAQKPTEIVTPRQKETKKESPIHMVNIPTTIQAPSKQKEPTPKTDIKEEFDIFSNLSTIEDYKKMLLILKDYQKANNNDKISATELQSLYHRK